MDDPWSLFTAAVAHTDRLLDRHFPCDSNHLTDSRMQLCFSVSRLKTQSGSGSITAETPDVQNQHGIKTDAETVVTTCQSSGACLSTSTSNVTRSASRSGFQLSRLPSHCTKDQCFDHRVHQSPGKQWPSRPLRFASLVWRPTPVVTPSGLVLRQSLTSPEDHKVGTRGEKSLRMIIWDSLVKSATTINWSLNPNNRLFK